MSTMGTMNPSEHKTHGAQEMTLRDSDPVFIFSVALFATGWTLLALSFFLQLSE